MSDLRLPGLDNATGHAIISDDGRYRYRLVRQLREDPHGHRVLTWVMLNPSTADAQRNDPTVRRVMRFTREHGYNEAVIVNLYALRATDPIQLTWADDPVGPDNLEHVTIAISIAEAVVVAWGTKPLSTPDGELLAQRVCDQVRELDKPLLCLGTTRDGMPRHPLYVKASTQLHRYSP